MSADTHEGNKAVEAMLFGMASSIDGLTREQFDEQAREHPEAFASACNALRASLLALANTITDEMAERGGRRLDPVAFAEPFEAEFQQRRDRATKCARACFAEMCRAAAGTDRDRELHNEKP